jgi:hypothetical protein
MAFKIHTTVKSLSSRLYILGEVLRTEQLSIDE